MDQELYTAIGDPYFAEPYIDEEGWREQPLRHYFVHGGFRGTEKNGFEVRFAFYFPEKQHYEGRFFQYLSPAPEGERESEHLTGEDDKISFALTHGAYYVVSNQGGFVMGDGERLYKSSANAAQFSRKIAGRLYGYEHRPYGYVFGGSGGSFKTMGCIEATTGVWDGAVPYVIANPMATPNVFCPRARVMRLLGQEGMARVMDAMEPGGSGDIYNGLDHFQREALEEATKMGFPKRAWFCAPIMGDGALMVLAPNIYALTPSYFTDFWEKPGFAGADPDSSECRDRIHFTTTVEALHYPEQTEENNFNSVDNNWMNFLVGDGTTPLIQMKDVPAVGDFTHCRIRILSGTAQGKEQPVQSIEGNILTVSSPFDGSRGVNALEGLAVGDAIMLDNSDYLAMQNFHRHQVPDESYYTYDQFRGADGTPIYPQVRPLIAPMIARGGSGVVPTGNIHCKTIALCSMLDESALPWHGDWYRRRVAEQTGDEENWFRLYYNDNCIHDDRGLAYLYDDQHTVDYLGVLHQALLDVAAWAEKGVAPAATTCYAVHDGQIEIPADADARGGIQPVVHAYANGEKCVHIKAGETVTFTAHVTVPNGTGIVTGASWDFEKTGTYTPCDFTVDGHSAQIQVCHCFQTAGTYFPTVRVQCQRNGSVEDIFTQCRNLDRVRVVVEA